MARYVLEGESSADLIRQLRQVIEDESRELSRRVKALTDLEGKTPVKDSRSNGSWISRNKATVDFGIRWDALRKTIETGAVRTKTSPTGKVLVSREDVERAVSEMS